MSLKDFFKKVEDDAEKVLHFLGHEVSELGDLLENELLPAVLDVVTFGKTVVDLDGDDLIGALAGKGGAALEDKLRIVINSAIPKLQAVQQFKNAGTSGQILKLTLDYLGEQVEDARTAFWIEFSGMVAADLADNQITFKEALSLLNYVEKNRP